MSLVLLVVMMTVIVGGAGEDGAVVAVVGLPSSGSRWPLRIAARIFAIAIDGSGVEDDEEADPRRSWSPAGRRSWAFLRVRPGR